MLFAQITDTHLGFDPGNPDEFNRKRLDETLAALCAGDVTPDLLFVTGDLTDRGDLESYRDLRAALAGVPFPVRFCMGNHDDRANFLAAFPESGSADGFIQYVEETGALRFIVLDTLEEGRHGGAFCAARAPWVRARLAADGMSGSCRTTFSPSAKLCRMPSGPTTLGPRLSAIAAQILRSA